MAAAALRPNPQTPSLQDSLQQLSSFLGSPSTDDQNLQVALSPTIVVASRPGPEGIGDRTNPNNASAGTIGTLHTQAHHQQHLHRHTQTFDVTADPALVQEAVATQHQAALLVDQEYPMIPITP